MWKAWEARRLENLLAEREPQETAKAIWAGSFSTYMYRYALCELLCFINVFAQLFMINRRVHRKMSNVSVLIGSRCI